MAFRTRQRARVLVALLVSSGVLSAQPQPPRFQLPEVPYDYVTLALPPGFPTKLLPPSNAPAHNPITNNGATLGRVLFYDRLLSRTRTRSCASCHEQSAGFADDRSLSRGHRGRMTKRNSMALVNLAFRAGGFFWDERSATLEEMVLLPIQDPIEMGLDVDTLVARLRSAAGYAELFARAFGSSEVTAERVGRALAQFVRSITSFRSKFDVGLAQAEDALQDFACFSPAENRGKRLFFGPKDDQSGRSCAACHLQPVHWGFCSQAWFLSPVVFHGGACRNNGVDIGSRGDDPGRARITGKSEDLGKFRAPSLRNLELTAPYMHDGRFRTLEEVVQFYDGRVQLHRALDRILQPPEAARAGAPHGWGTAPSNAQPGIVPMQNARPGLPMSNRERHDLVAFLRTLTDWELVRDPRFRDPFAPPRLGPAAGR